MPSSSLTDTPASILMVGSEALPFSKTGGLADVLGALPLALARLGCDVTLVTPRYRGVTDGTLAATVPLVMGDRTIDVGFFEASLGRGASSVKAVLVDAPALYDRDGLYGSGAEDYTDNPLRFGLLARAALEWAARQHQTPAVVHTHDWQGGLAPVYLKTRYAEHRTLGRAATVFTIHNLAYQGLCAKDWLSRLDLPGSVFTDTGLEFWAQISFLKAGINYSDAITTVSPRYAREIQTPELGFGFDGVLKQRADVISGVLNGIDVEQWNPAHDPNLPAPYSASDLSGKELAKADVLQAYGLPTDAVHMRRPLIGMISRMVDQKGLDLITAIADRLRTLGAAFVILGTGDAKYQDMWRALAKAHPTVIGVRVGFDEALAHRIEGGADIFMMPSRFEPCGLNQLYSLRYGTVPIVREVGGLADTVRDGVNGFVFTDYTPAALLQTLQRAVKAFGDQPKWRALQAAGMAEDHSWDRSAREYVRIYERVSGRPFP